MIVPPENSLMSMSRFRIINTRLHSLALAKVQVFIKVNALLRLLGVLPSSRRIALMVLRQISVQVFNTASRLDCRSDAILVNMVPLPVYHSTLLRDFNLGPLPVYQSTLLPGFSLGPLPASQPTFRPDFTLALLPVYQPISLSGSDPIHLPGFSRGLTSSRNIMRLNPLVNKSLVNHILILNMLYPISSRTTLRDMSIFILTIWTVSYPEKNLSILNTWPGQCPQRDLSTLMNWTEYLKTSW